MARIAPLPLPVRERTSHTTHPGLYLDKYAESWDEAWAGAPGKVKLSETVQKPTLERVIRLSQAEPPGLGFPDLLARRDEVLDRLGARKLLAETAGPLTLHLARATALENAGISLHPLYGFTYLPGSGLKGIARAYADTVWLPGQSDEATARERIRMVFGNDPGERDPERQRSGAVTFHDAWPVTWPRLMLDIVNNHHPSYYQAEGSVPPPGDWDNPVPVYFLAVEPGTRFCFALSPHRRDAGPEELGLAEEWLLAALVHVGAGAKSTAGYGRFRPVGRAVPELPQEARRSLTATLELVTPAFLAGARQEKNDCELRAATLRGLLRWWWRTLHAGFVTPEALRKLEAAVWGDTKAPGAVRIEVERISEIRRGLYSKRLVRKEERLPEPEGQGIPGLSYLSYGMDEKDRRRWFASPGAKWKVRLTVRPSRMTPAPWDEVELEQAVAALWLLCHYGGVGSKARKGFGSFAEPEALKGWSVQRCEEAAERLREKHGMIQPREGAPGSPSLQQRLECEFPTTVDNPWLMLDQLGESYQAFVKGLPKIERKALGLPRALKLGDDPGDFPLGPHVRNTSRHAAPVHFHLARGGTGLVIRFVAFPTPELPHDPTLQRSRQILEQLRAHLSRDFPPLRPGARIEGVLLAEKTGKGGWKVLHEPSQSKGPIVNSAEVPAGSQPGDRIELIVQGVPADGRNEPSFRVPPRGK